MQRKFLMLLVTSMTFLLFFPLLPVKSSGTFLGSWSLISTLIVGMAMALALAACVKSVRSSKEVALIAILITVISVSRVPFAIIPSVQPCTYLIISSGLVFGPEVGFIVGMFTPLISNIFLGHGPWTPYQMYAWGLIGIISGLLRVDERSKWGLALLSVTSGYLYGLLMNLWFWAYYVYPLTLLSFLFTEVRALIFDTLHALGNLLFMIFLGKGTIRILRRFKSKLNFEEISSFRRV